MSKPENISLYQFFERFPNEESARVYFEKKRWNDQIVCPHCGSEKTSECKNHKPMPYRCKSCRKHFSVRTGTVLAESRLPLHKWLMAMYMLTTARKGISSVQMAKELGITQKSAWFLAQRIRECWFGKDSDSDRSDKLEGIVEVDETYVGGKNKGMHAHKRKQHTRFSNKQIVLGMRERNGNVRAFHMEKNDRSMAAPIHKHVEKGSIVMTDSAAVYNHLSKSYEHHSVNHSVGEYVRGQAHTNGIESFWALLKRGHYGIYHYMSPKHLHRYVNEFSFRHNTREFGTMDFISATLTRAIGKRLKYSELIDG